MSSRFPDFIGIGAARSGTTWVARQLAQYYDIWLPRIKELHYFARSLKYDGPSYLNDSSLVKRVFSSIRAIVNLAIAEEGLDCSNAFAKTYFPNDDNAQSRQPISMEDIRKIQSLCRDVVTIALTEVYPCS